MVRQQGRVGVTSTEITAAFLEERHVFENDNGATRVVIADVQAADNSLITIKGESPAGRLTPGLEYRFYGRWIDHHKHGRQFAFTSYVMETPAGKRAVVVYLKQCKGIGYAVAAKIWDAFGEHSVEKLRTDPKAVAKAVKGFTVAKAVEASELLATQ